MGEHTKTEADQDVHKKPETPKSAKAAVTMKKEVRLLAISSDDYQRTIFWTTDYSECIKSELRLLIPSGFV